MARISPAGQTPPIPPHHKAGKTIPSKELLQLKNKVSKTVHVKSAIPIIEKAIPPIIKTKVIGKIFNKKVFTKI